MALASETTCSLNSWMIFQDSLKLDLHIEMQVVWHVMSRWKPLEGSLLMVNWYVYYWDFLQPKVWKYKGLSNIMGNLLISNQSLKSGLQVVSIKIWLRIWLKFHREHNEVSFVHPVNVESRHFSPGNISGIPRGISPPLGLLLPSTLTS